MRIKLESFQENLSLLKMANDRLMDLMSSGQSQESSPESQQAHKEDSRLEDYLDEIRKINSVRLSGVPLILRFSLRRGRN